MKVQHLVLTRYTEKREHFSYDRFSPEWLEERLRLFQTFAVPGMQHQTRDDYDAWLIICDETTDPYYVEQMRTSAAVVPQAQIATTSLERGIGIPEVVREFLDDDCDVLITTVLDSDDCLHSEMVGRVRSYADAFADSGHRELFVNFPRGYRYDATLARLYETTWIYGPFSSLFERLSAKGGAVRTVNGGIRNHNRWHHRTPMQFDYSFPAWIHVIHGLAASSNEPLSRGDVLTGGNMSSAILFSDIEVDPAEVGDAYGADLSRPVPAAVPPAGAAS